MRTNIVIIQSINEVEVFEKKYNSLLKNILFISIDIDAEAVLSQKGYNYKSIWDYISFEDLKDTGAYSEYLSSNWYKPLEHLFTHHGNSVGASLRWIIVFFFYQVINTNIAIQKLLEKETPNSVFLYADQKKNLLMGEDRKSCSSSVTNAIVAASCYEKRIPLRLFSKNRFWDTLFRLSQSLPDPEAAQFVLRFAYRLFLLDFSFLRIWTPTFISAPVTGLFFLWKWRNNYRKIDLQKKSASQKRYRVLFCGGGGLDFDKSMALSQLLTTSHEDFSSIVIGHPTTTSLNKISPEESWCDIHKYRFLSLAEKVAWVNFQKKVGRAFIRSQKKFDGRLRILRNPLFQSHFFFYLNYHNIPWWENMTKTILHQIKPHVIVVRWPMEIATESFKKAIEQSGLKTKIIYTLHGSSGPYKGAWLKDYSLPQIDMAASGGEVMNIILEDKGFSPSKICVTGYHDFDAYSGIQTENNFSSSKMTIVTVVTSCDVHLISSIWHMKLHKETLECLSSVPSESPNVKLRFKPHPRYDITEVIKDVCRKPGCNLVASTPISRLLSETDIVVCVNSGTTAAIEGAILKKPVLMILTARSPFCEEEIPIVKWQGAHCIYRNEDIAPSINKLIHDMQFRNLVINQGQAFLKRYSHDLDGRAGHRIADLIATTARSAAVGDCTT